MEAMIMTRIIMHGCNGHMGRVITDLVSKDDECKIVAGIDPFDDGHNDYPVFASVNDCDVEADVIIDFAGCLSYVFNLLICKSCCTYYNRNLLLFTIIKKCILCLCCCKVYYNTVSYTHLTLPTKLEV